MIWRFSIAMTVWCLMFFGTALAQDTKEEFCRKLQVHEAQGADYVPGVDVRGNPVAPADVDAPAPGIFDPVFIPVEIDLVSRFGLSVPAGVELKPGAAALEIYRDGRIVYNGQDITPRIHAICGEEVKTGEQGHGQDAPDAVPSSFGNRRDKRDSEEEIPTGGEPEKADRD